MKTIIKYKRIPVFRSFFIMCKYIFPARLFPKHLMTQCALILSSSRWHYLIHNDAWCFTQNDRRHKTKEYHQNWFEWLYCRAITVHSHLMVDVVNKQSVIKPFWFKNYWKQPFWEYGRDREYEPVEVHTDDDSDGKIICSNWTQIVTKLRNMLYCNFLKLSLKYRECFFFFCYCSI